MNFEDCLFITCLQNNLERSEFESKTRYTNQIDSLEKEVAILRKRIEIAEEEKAVKVKALEVGNDFSFLSG